MTHNLVGHIDLFPTPVAKYQNLDHTEFKKIIIEIMESTPSDKIFKGVGNISHFYNQGDLIEHNSKLEPFMNWVKECVKDYAIRFFGITDTEFIDLNVWINSNSGGMQPGHIHNNSYFSATYYVQLTTSKHVGLDFFNPRTAVARNPLIDVESSIETTYNTPSYKLSVEQGDLLIWPSECLHGYTQPEVDEPRISISMNFMPTIVKSSLYGFKVSKL
jgi:uncharacterized protein (TIGR02466 family)